MLEAKRLVLSESSGYSLISIWFLSHMASHLTSLTVITVKLGGSTPLCFPAMPGVRLRPRSGRFDSDLPRLVRSDQRGPVGRGAGPLAGLGPPSARL